MHLSRQAHREFLAEALTMTESELTARLERLERDNRRLKRAAIIPVLIAAALGAIFAARPTPDVIKAHAFQVVDSAGIVRATMTEDATGGASISLGFHKAPAALGLRRGLMVANVTINDPPSQGPGIMLGIPGQGRAYVGLTVTPKGEANIELQDAQDFSMDLGSANTVKPATGATQRTSAASIVMFGNDKKHHVIWQAP
jgi:hypothetical protein